MPARTQFPAASRTMSGPPLSPWHVSWTPSPAQTIVFGSTGGACRTYAVAHVESATMGTSAFSSTSDVFPPSSVVPHPMILATVPADQLDDSFGPITRSGWEGGGWLRFDIGTWFSWGFCLWGA